MAKFLISLMVLCALCANAVFAKMTAAEALADLMIKTQECRTEVNATEDDLKEMMEGKTASTMEGKCLHACIMKKYEVMNPEGKFDKEAALKHIEESVEGDEDKMKIATEIIDACADLEVPDDDCEAAVEYSQCFKEQAEAHGLKDFDM